MEKKGLKSLATVSLLIPGPLSTSSTEAGAVVLTIISVSYTHLDVYKRQILFNLHVVHKVQIYFLRKVHDGTLYKIGTVQHDV